MKWNEEARRALRRESARRGPQELADMIGCTRVSVWRWESGLTTPHPRYLQQVLEIVSPQSEAEPANN